jgi:hypothetical protein
VGDRAPICASNNADFYQAVFRAHGLKDHRDHALWRSDEPAPPYYSNATTLDPEASATQLAAIDRLKSSLGRSFSVKDGFCRLDLAARGFNLLFEATWIWGEPSGLDTDLQGRMPSAWQHVRDASALEAWEETWAANGSPSDDRVFPAAILDDPNVAILGRGTRSGFDAGCIANRSRNAVGLSNLFCSSGISPAVFAVAAAAASAFAPDLPVVGYERGERLRMARDVGFEPVGNLRVWISS